MEFIYLIYIGKKPEQIKAMLFLTNGGEYYRLRVEQKGRFKPEVSFESTPVVWNNQVMICGRDGGLYTLG